MLHDVTSPIDLRVLRNSKTLRPLPSRQRIPWANAVKERDRHTCQKCGRNDVRVDAHHIIPWRERLDLAYVLANGLTLCRRCHQQTHLPNGSARQAIKITYRTCPICQRLFVTRPSRPRLTCSADCAYISNGRSNSEPVIVACVRCGKTLIRPFCRSGPIVFCSTECRTVAPRRPCEVCGTIFKPKAQQIHRGQGRYCSRKCLGIFQRGENNPNFGHHWTDAMKADLSRKKRQQASKGIV